MNHKILPHEHHKIRNSTYVRRKKKKQPALAVAEFQTNILGIGVQKAGPAVDDLIKGLRKWEAALALTNMITCLKSNRQLLCYSHKF